jgi:poly(A) polymerase
MLEILLTLAQAFRDQGYELYVVGGAVRDLLLHHDAAADADLATNARPDEIKRLAAPTHPVSIVTVGEQFGTVRLLYRRADGASDSLRVSARRPESQGQLPDAIPDSLDIIEITTYRSDRYNPDSRKPEVTFGDTLEGDLLRRDFTINAMARDPLTGEIVDPYGGRSDLEQGIIRAVGDDPERRFDEDPLRLLRGARFAAQLGFVIEPATLAAMRRQAQTLGKISSERIRDEFTKLLLTPKPSIGIRLLVDQDLMPAIVPEVLDLRGVSQLPTPTVVRSKDVYDHVLKVVDRAAPRSAVRWAGLLHDIAKPRTRSLQDGKIHFYGHEDVGAHMARDILRRLKFSRPFIEHVCLLVRLHMRVNAYTPDWTDGAVRRMMLEAGDALPDLLDLSRADITSYRPEKVSRAAARIDELESRSRWLLEEAERVPLKSPLDGHDLMKIFGRGPGPWLRPLKDYLLGLVIDGRLLPDDRAGAEAEARAFLLNMDSMDLMESRESKESREFTEAPAAPLPSTPPLPDPSPSESSRAEARALSRRRSKQQTLEREPASDHRAKK